MSAPDSSPLAESPGLARDGDGPVFSAPWEARAFAMAVRCHEEGLFSWPDWAETLGGIIRTHPDLSYYEQWLLALETILSTTGTVHDDERLKRVDAWDRAARATPHGEPIELGRDHKSSA